VETLARVVAQGEAVRTCPKSDDGNQAGFLFRDQDDAAQKTFGVAERMAHGDRNFRLNSRGSAGRCDEFETLGKDLLMMGGAMALARRERFGRPFRRRIRAEVVLERTDVHWACHESSTDPRPPREEEGARLGQGPKDAPWGT